MKIAILSVIIGWGHLCFAISLDMWPLASMANSWFVAAAIIYTIKSKGD